MPVYDALFLNTVRSQNECYTHYISLSLTVTILTSLALTEMPLDSQMPQGALVVINHSLRKQY